MSASDEGGSMETSTTRRAPIGAILLLIGGALAATGSFLTWADVRVGDVSASAKGVDGSDGYITLVLGVVAILAGFVALRAPKRAIAVVGIIAGVVIMGVGIYDATTAEDSVLDSVAEDVAPSLGAPVDQVRNVLQQQADSGQLDVSLQIGLYAVIAGGALALVGGVIAAATAKRQDATDAAMPAAAGPPMTTSTTSTVATTPSAGAWPSGSPAAEPTPPAAAPPPPPPAAPPE
jgi:hypothetical protein